MKDRHEMLREVRDLDLNLLVALDAMLEERSVTGAARRLGLTQSAMSHKLKRLRDALGDPLFASGRHGLLPTPRSQSLERPLRRALYDIAAALRTEEGFDPLTSRREITVAASDLLELSILPRLLASLGVDAPRMRLTFRQRTPASSAALRTGDLDLLIQPGSQSVPGIELQETAGIQRRHLADEDFRVVARADHPALGGRKRLTLKRYLDAAHVLVTPGGGPTGVADHVLSRLGHARHVALRVPHFAAAPILVARTDLLLTCPTGLAEAAAEIVPLRVFRAPFELPQTRVFMYWHERFQQDPAHRWIREYVATFTQHAST
ncbi:MAG: LysR family transcriptional regulator [Myxococcota bacterium]